MPCSVKDTDGVRRDDARLAAPARVLPSGVFKVRCVPNWEPSVADRGLERPIESACPREGDGLARRLWEDEAELKKEVSAG